MHAYYIVLIKFKTKFLNFSLDPNNKQVIESIENLGKPCNTSTATSTDSTAPISNGSHLDATSSGVNIAENESIPSNAVHGEDTLMDSDH